MDSSQDQAAENAALDLQYPPFQTSDLPATFASIIGSSHPDAALPPPNASSHMASLFPSDIDPTNSLSMSLSMQMPMSDLQPSSNGVHMDIMHSVPSDHSSGILSDFSPQNDTFVVDSAFANLDGLDTSHQLLSSPSATTASTSVSHTSSPAATGMASTYSIGSSSLASALDSMAAVRSRSDSASASPANMASSSSDLGFQSGSGGPPTSTHESAFQYSPPLFDNSFSTPQESSPADVPGGAHLLVLGDMLKNIARTANSGSEACSAGQGADARELVENLKKNVLFVAELIGAMQLGGDSGSIASHPSLHALPSLAPSAPPIISSGLDVAQQHINSLPLFSSPAGSSDDTMLDMSDSSRKRCASSVGNDRAMKTMKLEPQDDAAIPLLSSVPLHTPPSLSGPPFTFASRMGPSIQPSLSTVPEPALSNVPVSMSGSRPPSSSGPPGRHSFSLHPESQQHFPQAGLHFSPSHINSAQPLSHAPIDFGVVPSTSAATTSGSLMSLSGNGVSWSDNRPPLPRHTHSLSAGSSMNGISHPGLPMPGTMSLQYPAQGMYNPNHSAQPMSAIGQLPHPGARAARSASISTLHSSTFAYGIPESAPAPPPTSYDTIPQPSQSRPSTSHILSGSPRGSSPEFDDDADGDSDDGFDYSQSYDTYHSSPDGSPDNRSNSDPMAGILESQPRQRRMSRASPSDEGNVSGGHSNEVPQEYKTVVETVFFDFLNTICSNLDATDAKGEPIHQTLMAKKMQRLDESPDFRPFKFRIQAFTNAFLEELARQGYPEEKIPMKKIRNFLWSQPYISRFNEEGKKSKSKGNHIWHVDAKKSDNGWLFRPFKRRLAGAPPGVAYVGLRWSWTPRIWDPQASRSNMPVQYSSPSLPSWLSWKDDVLSGTPPPDAESCDVTVEARFMQDGKEEVLTHTVQVNVAPMAVDATFPRSRRPSLIGDIHNPRRILSDTALVQNQTPRLLRTQTALAPAAPSTAPNSQVVQVLTTAAQRVAQEAQSQVVASPNDAGPGLQALAKQQHVLTVTAQAFNAPNGETLDGSATQSNLLTAAAQQVVLQAARQIAADRSVAVDSSGAVVSPSAAQITVKEVSVATQSAVAQAVDMVGPLSSEVDVLMTAKSLLLQQTRVSPSDSQSVADSVRSNSTAMASVTFGTPAPLSSVFFPPLPTLGS